MKIYSTKEFALEVGVTVKTLFNWEQKGLLIAKRKINGYKYYTEDDVKKVMGIEET